MNKFLIIGDSQDQRITRFQQALDRLRLPPATVIDYPDLVNPDHVNSGSTTDTATLADHLSAGDTLRLESPGKSARTQQLLLQLGTSRIEPHFERTAAGPHPEGFLYSSRQWYLGYCAILDRIDQQRSLTPPHRVMNGAKAIRTMFDKRATQQILQRAGIPVPPFLPPIHSYDELRAAMAAQGVRRIFIKPAHGSSASGAMAYETDGHREKVTTTIEHDAQWHLYNSLKVRTVRDHATIRRLIDTICRHRVHVERWIPKGSLHGQRFDVRVLVIGGNAEHSVVRLSRSPFTNLHLGNDRAPVDALIEQIGVPAWQAVQRTCERAAACFPDAFYTGIDLLFTPDLRRHYVLELNAFGDLLLRVKRDGMDPYELEIRRFLG